MGYLSNTFCNPRTASGDLISQLAFLETERASIATTTGIGAAAEVVELVLECDVASRASALSFEIEPADASLFFSDDAVDSCAAVFFFALT